VNNCFGLRLPVNLIARTMSSLAPLRGLLLVPPLALLVPGSPVFAADDNPEGNTNTVAAAQVAAPPGPESSGAGLQEVVVTAQKRSQAINDVGMAITALSGEQLKDEGVRSVGDLTKIEPSFVFSNSSYGQPVYSIRGVGYNEKSLAASPAVSVYVDEVPYAYPALTKAATLDLQRVEVLKGPQGTLFGQNATGGAINYIAAKPTDRAESGVEVTYGRFGALDVNGFLSGPISDTLKGRLAFDLNEGGAWQKSVTQGTMLGNQNNMKVRLLLDWEPSSDLRFALNVNGWTDKSDSLAAQLEKATPQDTYLIPELAGNPAVQTRLVNLVSQLVNYPVVQNNQAADWNTGTTPMNDEKFYQTALRTEYSLAESATLTSITSYEHYTQNNLIDNDGLALNANDEQEQGSINSFSQEVRASGGLLDNRLDWLGGLAFANDRVTENNIGNLPDSTPAYAFTPFGLDPFSSIGIFGASEAKTKAAFGNLEFKVLPDLSLHAGARYTKSDIDFKGCLYNTDQRFADGLEVIQGAVKGAGNVIPTGPGQCVTLDANFNPNLVVNSLDQNNVSWRTGADWHFNPDSLLYASVSKGFKAGSFPVLPGTGAVQFDPATQESVLAYEVGYKGDLLDKRVSLDAAFFHYDYRNKQLLGRKLDPAGVFGVIDGLINVPKSTEDGVEFNAILRPLTGLSLAAGVTYLDARVTGKFDTYDPFTGQLANFDGYAFPSTPKWVGSLSSRYEWSITGDLTGSIGADYRYQTSSESAFVSRDDYAPGAQYFPGYSAGSLEIPSYGLLDLRAGIGSADGRWNVQLFGKNVTNKYYWTQAVHVYDTTVRYPGLPATYGITVAFRFQGT
jgi:iron complex outermembrane recepter protein